VNIFNKRPAEDVETERARLMARADAAGHQEMVRRIQRNADHQERAEARRLRRIEKLQRQKDRAQKVRAYIESVRQRLILLLPLLFVNILALAGQIGFATDHLGWNLPAAVMFGATLESIAVYIGWHAHQALLSGDSAIKLRGSSYLVGAIVGGLNYEHFADDGGMPTVKSVVFGLMSLISPWLWAMHGRYANRKRLRELGLIDERAPHFAGGRWVHFPVQTWGALRWGIANNVQDPAAAWDGYQTARRVKTARKALAKDKRPTVRVTVVRTVTRTVPARPKPLGVYRVTSWVTAQGMVGSLPQATLGEVTQGTPEVTEQVTSQAMPQATGEVTRQGMTQTTPNPVTQGMTQDADEATARVTRQGTRRATTKSRTKSRRTDAELISELQGIVAEHYREHPGEEINVKPVAKQLGIGRDRARRLLDQMNVRPIRKAN
jgi:hypothetical protein